MKAVKLIVAALVIVGLSATMAFAMPKDSSIVCTVLPKDIIEVAPKKDLVYTIQHCSPCQRAHARLNAKAMK